MNIDNLKFFGKVYHHKFIVIQFMNKMIHELISRAEVHDKSKFDEDEFPHYSKITSEFENVPYGTPEATEIREKFKDLFERHAKKNRHHPEFHPNGIDDMTLVDLIELLSDWKASSIRDNNDIMKSIQICGEKYKISPQLLKILENTAKTYMM